MLCPDSCLQPDTRNFYGTPGNVFGRSTCTEQTDNSLSRKCKKSYRYTLRTCVSEHRKTCSQSGGNRKKYSKLCDTHTEICWEVCNFPQHCMVEQPRNQVSEMHFVKFLNPSTFQCWKTSFKTWMKEVEMVDSVDDLKTSQSIGGHRFRNFEMLDAKIASALIKIIMNPYFRKKVSLEEQKSQMEDRKDV